MVLHVQFNHIYKYPFELVAKSYFRKYTSGKDSNVLAITVEEQSYDPESGVEIIRRRGQCNNVVPWVFRKILGDASVYFEEKAELNRNERSLHLHTWNLTWSAYVLLEEKSEFRFAEDNPEWTVFTQEGIINCFGLGPLGPLGERLAKAFLLRGGQKSIGIMESIIRETYSERRGEAIGEHAFI